MLRVSRPPLDSPLSANPRSSKRKWSEDNEDTETIAPSYSASPARTMQSSSLAINERQSKRSKSVSVDEAESLSIAAAMRPFATLSPSTFTQSENRIEDTASTPASSDSSARSFGSFTVNLPLSTMVTVNDSHSWQSSTTRIRANTAPPVNNHTGTSGASSTHPLVTRAVRPSVYHHIVNTASKPKMAERVDIQSEKVKLVLPSAIIARKAQRVKQGLITTPTESPYSMPSPPQLVKDRDGNGNAINVGGMSPLTIMTLAASPTSSISNCQSSVASPLFSDSYSYSHRHSISQSVSQSPMIERRFSLPGFLPSGRPSLLRAHTKPSSHALPPAHPPVLARRITGTSQRWKILGTAFKMKQRWKKYRKPSNGDDSDEDLMDSALSMMEEPEELMTTRPAHHRVDSEDVAMNHYDPYDSANCVPLTVSTTTNNHKKLSHRRHTGPSGGITINLSRLSAVAPLVIAKQPDHGNTVDTVKKSLDLPQNFNRGRRHSRHLTYDPNIQAPLLPPTTHSQSPAQLRVLYIDQFALCLVFQFLDCYSLIKARRVNGQWFETSNLPLSWRYQSLRLECTEELVGDDRGNALPLPKWPQYLPIISTKPLTVHQLTDTLCDSLSLSLKFLRSLDLSSLASYVSPEWLGALCHSLPRLTTLSLSYNDWLNDSHITEIAQCRRVRYVDLACCSITNAGMRALSMMTGLLSIDVSGCQSLTDEGMDCLASMTQLLSINLSCCSHITDTSFTFLCLTLPSLIILDTSWTSIIGIAASVNAIQSLQSLLVLNLSYSKSLTDSSMQALTTLNALQTLDMFSCTEITDKGIELLCQTRTDVSGSESGATYRCQRASMSLANQRDSLIVGNNDNDDDDDLSLISLPFKSFSIGSRSRNASPMAPTRRLGSSHSHNNSVSVSLCNSRITSASLSQQGSPGVSATSITQQLSELSYNPPIASVTESPCLPSLTSLSLGAIRSLSSTALERVLSALPALRFVDLQFTAMDDVSLTQLPVQRKYAALQAMNLQWCDGVTSGGLEALSRSWPQCSLI